MYKALAALFAISVFGTVARAQTMAAVTDQVMVLNMANGESDTLESHTISAGLRSRADSHSHGGMLAQMWGGSSSEIMNASDSGFAMTILNHDKKTYLVWNLGSMFDSAGNIFSGAGGSMKFDSTGDSTTVDSLGPGPVIAGHPTFHYRTHSTMKMSMALMGQNMSTSTELTSDMFVAPDIPSEESDSGSAARMSKLMGSGGMFGSMGAKLGSGNARIAKKGTALRVISQTVMHMGPMTQTQRMSVETLSYKKMVVPDSVFAIPAGYTKSENMFGIPPE